MHFYEREEDWLRWKYFNLVFLGLRKPSLLSYIELNFKSI